MVDRWDEPQLLSRSCTTYVLADRLLGYFKSQGTRLRSKVEMSADSIRGFKERRPLPSA